MPAGYEDSVRLIRAMARGDGSAFDTFYDRYAPLVCAVARRILGDRADADDVVQDVFLQLWRKSGRYKRERGSPDAWIVTVTRTRAIDRLRAVRRQSVGQAAAERDRALPNAATSGGAGEAIVDARLTVTGALSEIPQDQRRALEMAYFDGLTQTEIAASLAIPLGTVKTRMRLGLKRLRELLGAAATGDASA